MRTLRDVGTLVERAAAFLAGDGCDVVPRNLRALGLPQHLCDDVVQEALISVHRAEESGVEPEILEAFVTTIAKRRAQDMLRGKLRRPEATAPAPHRSDDPQESPEPKDDGPLPEDQAVSAEELARFGGIVDDTRRRFATLLAANPDRAAAALVVLAIVHGDASPAEDCPAPTGGVAQSEAVSWAGLFYGGADRCFPSPGHLEDAAMRKRRSRALGRLRALLLQVGTDLGAILEVDDD